jgi:hypothetical protein
MQVNETCADMAGYVGRLVEHYTQGGHHDSCGHWHGGGFTYNWDFISILNENEHNTGGTRYTICFDAIRAVVENTLNSSVRLAGPEEVLYAKEYTYAFLDPKNHKDGRAPDILSNHFYGGALGGKDGHDYEGFFTNIDNWMESLVLPLVALKDAVAPKTELLLNEFIPFLNE